MVVPVSVERHIPHGQTGFGRRRRGRRPEHTTVRRGERLRLMVVALHVRIMGGLAFALRLGRAMVMVFVTSKARNQSHRDHGSYHGVGAEQHQRSAKTRNPFCPTASKPRPCRAHDDVALQQQDTDAGGLHDFGLPGMGSKGRAGGPGQDPQSGRTGIGHNPGSEHQPRRPRPSKERPNQLKNRDRGKEHPRRQPIPPMHRRDGEMDHRRTNGGDRRTPSSQPTVGTCPSFGGSRHCLNGHTALVGSTSSNA